MSWQSGSCEANGISIRYLQTGGSKPPVVLLHGLTGTAAVVASLAGRALRDLVLADPTFLHSVDAAAPGE